MKKVVFCTLVAICAVGCSNMQRSNGRHSMLTQPVVQARLKAEMQVGQEIKGSAVCESWFWGIYRTRPTKQTYGAVLQTEEGNMAPNECTRGAVYNALAENKAEYIVDPKYDTNTLRSICLLGKWLCLHKTQQVTITGYKANVAEFKNIPLIGE